MDQLAQLPSDVVFFTPITMEAAEDLAFLKAMRRANIKGALVGIETVTPEGLKVLGSFIFGLPSDRPSTFAATGLAIRRAHRVTRLTRALSCLRRSDPVLLPWPIVRVAICHGHWGTDAIPIQYAE
jgi:hypothetical protein